VVAAAQALLGALLDQVSAHDLPPAEALAMLSFARHANLSLGWRAWPAQEGALAHDTNLSPRTLGPAVRQLAARGLIRPAPHVPGTPPRAKAFTVAVLEQAAAALGLEPDAEPARVAGSPSSRTREDRGFKPANPSGEGSSDLERSGSNPEPSSGSAPGEEKTKTRARAHTHVPAAPAPSSTPARPLTRAERTAQNRAAWAQQQAERDAARRTANPRPLPVQPSPTRARAHEGRAAPPPRRPSPPTGRTREWGQLTFGDAIADVAAKNPKLAATLAAYHAPPPDRPGPARVRDHDAALRAAAQEQAERMCRGRPEIDRRELAARIEARLRAMDRPAAAGVA
jgi:hypothetical protein